MKHQLRHSAAIVVLAGLAIVAAGCSDARLAANNAASNGGQPNNGQVQPTSYQTGYGLTSDGPTTDLYHEFKHSLEPPERPQVAATVQQGAPAPVNGQQVADSSTGPGAIQQSATQQGVTQQGVAQQGVAQQPVAQQPAAPPREAPTATVYGMSSDGPTTDVYTALFGRNH